MSNVMNFLYRKENIKKALKDTNVVILIEVVRKISFFCKSII